MMADGLGARPSANALMPLRAIYRQTLACTRWRLDPTAGVQFPAVRGNRDAEKPCKSAT